MRPDAPSCPCGHPLQEALRTIGLQPEGAEPLVIDHVSVWVCDNCDFVQATAAGRERLFAALGADLHQPLPIRVKVFLQRAAQGA